MSTLRRAMTLLGAAALLAVGAAPAGAETSDTEGLPACDRADGVTVVVDFSDLGGGVASACAEGDPASGREALEAAGFTPTTDDAGLICAIDAQPDPCPTEFTGSYWAYWQMVDGEWVASQVGPDDADPAPGDIEGWRYNDGSEPPLQPVIQGDATTATDDTADATSGEASGDAGGGISPALWAVIVVVAGLVIGLVIRRTRSAGS